MVLVVALKKENEGLERGVEGPIFSTLDPSSMLFGMFAFCMNYTLKKNEIKTITRMSNKQTL